MKDKIKNWAKRSILSIVIGIFIVSLLLTIFLLSFFFDSPGGKWNIDSPIQITIYVLIAIVSVLNIIFIILLSKQSNDKSKMVNKGINSYVENLVSSLSVGIIIFQPNKSILWTSDFIDERFGEDIINKKLNFFNSDLDDKKRIQDFSKIFKYDEYVYQLKFVSKEMVLIVKDITQEYSATHFYEVEKLVVGEIEIDNYQLFRSSLSDEDTFNIQSLVKNLFDDLSKKYNFVYKSYMDGKYLVLTNRDNLNKMILNNFAEFESLSKSKVSGMRISLSVGFGTDSSEYSKLVDMAKEALYQSQTRGGDQITVLSSVEKTKRFGSKSEISVVKSRTKIKNVANNFKIKLQDKKIKNVVIYGHKYADLDAIGAAYALYEVAISFGKNAYIQNTTFDHTGQKAVDKYIRNIDDIFVAKVKTKLFNKDETIIVLVDCAEETRVENPTIFSSAKGENIFIFDHHRVSKLDEIIDNLNVYIESTASSASEIVTELIQFNEFQDRISSLGAQMLLNGIYLDTNQFKKSTTSRTFAAASMLDDWGASIEESQSLMKISQDTNEKIIQLLSKSKEVKPGYWLSYTSEIIPIDVISMAADEILRIEGRKAAFVIAQLPQTSSNSNNPTYKLSARSIGGVNVQLIAEAVGGGGHFNAAAAVSDSNANESLETFVDNIIQSIVSVKE